MSFNKWNLHSHKYMIRINGGNGSGTGSNMSRNNNKYIELLESIMEQYKIKTICDVGCGDWQFSQHVDFGDRKYLGVDCVKSVIDENIKNFKKKNINFQHKSIGDDYTPKGYDLVIIKDVIQHWTDEDIIKYYKIFLKDYR